MNAWIKTIKSLCILSLIILAIPVQAADVPITLFPLENYNQSVDHWINPQSPDYDQPLVTAQYQKDRLDELYNHVYGSDNKATSPWSPVHMNSLLTEEPGLASIEQELADAFTNANLADNKIGYGENFRAHTQAWIDDIKTNMNINQFTGITFDTRNRGIAVTNLSVRILPTDEPSYHKFTLPGNGYPFDNLQMSSLWAGTPVYIAGTSKDKFWCFIFSPSFSGWVKSTGIARATPSFVTQWQRAAKNSLGAIIRTRTTIIDRQGRPQLQAYMGSFFPLTRTFWSQRRALLIPTRNKSGMAKMTTAFVSPDSVVKMPYAATPHHFSQVLSNVVGRPYGWGGSYFYNDCSQELKVIYGVFGIWLPRHSSYQVHQGLLRDWSDKNIDERLQLLSQDSDHHRLMTVIYVGGHVMLYLGHIDGIPMTYQNIWGLSPPDRDRRAVIGESLFFPLLKTHREDSSLSSLAGRRYFQVAYLDQWPSEAQLGGAQPMTLQSYMKRPT